MSTAPDRLYHYGGVPVDIDVDVRAYDDLSDAISSLGATETTVVISNSQTVSTDETIPATMTMRFLRGGSLSIDAGKTVTVNGQIDAGLFQIFEGAGSVAFGLGAVREVYPQWWGANPTDSVDDTAAIQAAIDSLDTSNGGTVFLPTGTYYVGASASIKMRYRVNIIGAGGGLGGTVLKAVHGDTHYPVLENDTSENIGFFTVGHFWIDFSSCNDSVASDEDNDIAIKVGTTRLQFVCFEDIFISYAKYVYHDITTSWMMRFDRIWASQCRNGFIRGGSGSTYVFNNVHVEGSEDASIDGIAWQLQNMSSSVLNSCTLEKYTTDTKAAYFDAMRGLTLNGFRMEYCDTDGTNGTSILFFNACQGLTVNSLYSINCDLVATNGNSTSLVKIDDCNGVFNSACLGDKVANDDSIDGGNATSFCKTVNITGSTNYLTFSGCRLTDIPTKGGGAYIGYKESVSTAAATGVSVTLDSCELGTLDTDTNNIRIDSTKYIASDTWDPGSIGDGAEEAKDVTVTGAALGDFAVASFSLDVTDLVLNAQVTTANVVTCVLANNTGGAIDLASGTVYVKVIKK